jgi:hypothetical protein
MTASAEAALLTKTPIELAFSSAKLALPTIPEPDVLHLRYNSGGGASMAVRRVFVIWMRPLFRDLVCLLLSHPDVEWVGATSDQAVACAQIASLRPDTILIEEGEKGGVCAEVLEILEASASDVRVKQLSRANNEVSVYHREQRTLVRGEDLLSLVRTGE